MNRCSCKRKRKQPAQKCVLVVSHCATLNPSGSLYRALLLWSDVIADFPSD
ncbi:hypothetical protein J122_1553 [Marinobacter excellens LAMA 842]|uniref:Uncharacterized protein n=1 Tax=Marinobacter excellens LAMA 842 TaxID=1306954 RepID=A0A137SDH0_9GAMM|nr:hypothetical protein J122_1553 [Marinobacter excellens LAMA 842]